MGADASCDRPKSRRAHLEPAGLGTPHRQNSPQSTHPENFASSRNRSLRPTSRRRISLQSGRRSRRNRQGNRKNGAASRAQLAVAASYSSQRHHGRPQRRTTPPESRLCRLEPQQRSSRQARRRQQHTTRLPLLAPAPIRQPQPHPHLAALAPSARREFALAMCLACSSNAVPYIQTQALTKRFGRVPALDGLDFSVQGGAIHALVGPSRLALLRTLSL